MKTVRKENDMENKIKNLEKQITDERARLSTDRMDISFGELINMYKAGELVIRPEYQRLFRWTRNQKTMLIESILLGIPVPPVFVAEDGNGIWELVDGLQRVSTIISFFGELDEQLLGITMEKDMEEEPGEEENNVNKWVLESGSLINDLEGFDVDTLPKKYIINIKRAVCRVEILRGESNTAMKYELFKRLNSGGSKLTPQEIRNAIYRGIDPKVNTLIEELSKNQDFKALVSLSTQKKKELYDQELVLRFIAFLNKVDEVNSNTEAFLDKFMENAVKDHDFNENYYRDTFTKVIKMLKEVCGELVFRNERNAFVPAYYEGIMIGIAQNIEKYQINPQLISERVILLKEDNDFKKYSGSASNSRSRVKNRLTRANKIFSQ
ncbi:MAG: DUF262 domain-containing protein [Hungatella sp.]|jgi:uncharacterized protein with ParB-like and HNH nuclease domain|nr:DUF262 domain-containing protein [Hungatella sp.]